MDDENLMKASKGKGEVTNKVKDSYGQLSDKMEQVKSQVSKMERKYDELYQTVKAKDSSRGPSMSSENDAMHDHGRGSRDSIDQIPASIPRTSKHDVIKKEERSSGKSVNSTEPEYEKKDENPFL